MGELTAEPSAEPFPIEAPEAETHVLMRAVPLQYEEEEEEKEEVDECVDPNGMVVAKDERKDPREECSEDEREDPREECIEDEREDPREECNEDEREDPREESVKDDAADAAIAATPGKETVHYDMDAVLPPCPAGKGDQTPAMSPAEQMKLATKKSGQGKGRGRGRGGKGSRGRGRGRSGRGRGKACPDDSAHSDGHEAESKRDDRGDGEITPTEKEETSEDEAVHVKAHERSRPKRSCSVGSDRACKKAKVDTRKRKRAASPSQEAEPEKAPKPKATKPKAKAQSTAEPEAASKDKTKRGPKAAAKPVPKAKGKAVPKAKGEAVPKAKGKAVPKAKAKPVPKAKAKEVPKAAAKAVPKAKAAAAKTKGASHDKGDVIAERKARLSRKSVAYHKAMKQGKDAGKSLEECKELAKQATLCAPRCMCVCVCVLGVSLHVQVQCYVLDFPEHGCTHFISGLC